MTTPAETTQQPVQFDKEFQSKLVQAIIFDKEWAPQILEVINVDECIDIAHLKWLTKKFTTEYHTHKVLPSIELMFSIVNQDLTEQADSVLKNSSMMFLRGMKNMEKFPDLPSVKSRAFEFCKKQLMVKALEDAAKDVLSGDYDTMLAKLNGAANSGIVVEDSIIYDDDIDLRYDKKSRNVIATGFDELDVKEVLNGGLGEGEVGIIVASSGLGKSQILVNIGANAVLQGKNVFYYTLELNRFYVGVRFDANLIAVNNSDCTPAAVKIWLERNKDLIGKLIIKEMPAGVCNTRMIKAHIDRMKTKGIYPDLIVMDYAGIMRSCQKTELLRQEMQWVIRELKQLGKEVKCPIWTALQTNRTGAKVEVVTETEIAESFGQIFEADLVMGFSRSKQTSVGKLANIKSRLGPDGQVWTVHLDTAQSRLSFLTDEELVAMKEKNPGMFADMAGSDDGETAKRRVPKNKAQVQEMLAEVMKSHGKFPMK